MKLSMSKIFLRFENSFVVQGCGQCEKHSHLLINSYLLSHFVLVVSGLTGISVG
jgi:hypothetical protein